MWRDPNPSAEVLLKRILTLLQKKEINPHLCADSFGIYGKKQTQEINQNKLDQEEFEFLKLNLLYSSKCQKTIFKKGYKVGTPEYKNCILKRGRE